jgi:hypothetical protein
MSLVDSPRDAPASSSAALSCGFAVLRPGTEFKWCPSGRPRFSTTVPLISLASYPKVNLQVGAEVTMATAT